MEPINVLSPLVPIFDKADPSLLSMGWLLPIPIYAGFALAYWKLAPNFETDRQRAYILSTISAFVMTLISLPFLWTYLVYGLETVYEAAQGGWLGMVGRFGVVFFGTYLFGQFCSYKHAIQVDVVADVSGSTPEHYHGSIIY